jgi:hypothetical protein
MIGNSCRARRARRDRRDHRDHRDRTPSDLPLSPAKHTSAEFL